MARRRMISQDIISDEHFNKLSLEAQNIFIRMLTVSDDCGVVPAGHYRLNVLINTPKDLIDSIGLILDEIADLGMGYLISHNGEHFFVFKPESFRDYQSYILKKATRSEYLRISKDEFIELSKTFQELPRISSRLDKSALSTVESIKHKVESKEYKDKEYFLGIFNTFLPPELQNDWCALLDYYYERGDYRVTRSTIIEQAKYLRDNIKDAKRIMRETIKNNWKKLAEVKDGRANSEIGAKPDELAGIVARRFNREQKEST